MNPIKYILTCVLATFSIWGNAQKVNNTLLNADFWKNNPTVETVKSEVAKGNSTSERNPTNMDAVCVAILNNAPIETVQYLIDQNIDLINKPTHEGRTYLNWASLRGNEPVMKYLIEKGADINYKDAHGATPFLATAGAGADNVALLEYLISKGADFKAKNKSGASALLLAAQKDKTFVVSKFLKSKGLSIKDTDANGNNIFYYAARGGNVPMMKELVKEGIKFDNNAYLALAQGGKGLSGGLDAFQYLATLKLSPKVANATQATPLHFAAKKAKQLDIVKYLVEKGLDINAEDADGNSILMNAASNGDLEMVKYILPLSNGINKQNKAGHSALSLAVKNNAPDVVQYLIDKKADINVVDKNGENLNYYLVDAFKPRSMKDFGPKVEALRKAGLNLLGQSPSGNNILHYAAAENKKEVVEMALKYGIDINAVNKDHMTALHKAALVAKSDEILKILIAAGADKSLKTSFDETAFDLASENEHLSKQNISVDFLK